MLLAQRERFRIASALLWLYSAGILFYIRVCRGLRGHQTPFHGRGRYGKRHRMTENAERAKLYTFCRNYVILNFDLIYTRSFTIGHGWREMVSLHHRIAKVKPSRKVPLISTCLYPCGRNQWKRICLCIFGQYAPDGRKEKTGALYVTASDHDNGTDED